MARETRPPESTRHQRAPRHGLIARPRRAPSNSAPSGRHGLRRWGLPEAVPWAAESPPRAMRSDSVSEAGPCIRCRIDLEDCPGRRPGSVEFAPREQVHPPESRARHPTAFLTGHTTRRGRESGPTTAGFVKRDVDRSLRRIIARSVGAVLRAAGLHTPPVERTRRSAALGRRRKSRGPNGGPGRGTQGSATSSTQEGNRTETSVRERSLVRRGSSVLGRVTAGIDPSFGAGQGTGWRPEAISHRVFEVKKCSIPRQRVGLLYTFGDRSVIRAID